MEEYIATSAIRALSDFLSRYYGKKVLLLLDEYDTPMQEAYAYGYWEEISGFTRSLFNSAFKTNPYLERALMTVKTGKFSAYWANTSSNSLVGKVIQKGSADIKSTMELLLSGQSFHTQIDEQIVFNQLDQRENAIWSLLLASGYLKVENHTVDEMSGKEEYELSLTNKEVYIMFQRMIQEWFAQCMPFYNDFIRALLNGDVKAMNVYMNKIMHATYIDFGAGE